ncbi:MAG: hypothetical protein CMG71_03010 [Candidatus Marinimicrobia bacterium]|nr:hypothetical protein [Candidatus Neomarinimicrobiota bacterium]
MDVTIIPEIIQTYNLQAPELLLIFLSAVGIGMAKTGLHGMGFLAVPIMAGIFEARASTGIVLILLIFADFFGVWFYHRHANMKMILRLSPSTILGIGLGIVIGDRASDAQFTLLLAGVLILGALIIGANLNQNLNIKSSPLLSLITGIFAGFSTMIGNSAGPIMSIYFLSMGLDKNRFIGTGAWFFLLVNLFKLPFHIFVWRTIDASTFYFDAMLIPAIVLGAFTGVWLVKKIPEKPYKIIVVISVILAALQLTLNSL